MRKASHHQGTVPDNEKTKTDDRTREPTSPTASVVLDDGRFVELVYDPKAEATNLVVSEEGSWRVVRRLGLNSGRRLVPFSPNNNLIRNEVVVLPSAPEEYGSEEMLVSEVREYIHRYVDVSARFEQLTSYYVLLTWVYDRFNELPYLRLRGDYGSGKTRFLLTVGALCNKPIFASGASTVSPLFHTLDAFRGTLVLDESDFRFSDEKADIVKILNNGNMRGLPVLRTEVSAQREYNPRAFQVFGPKLVATRGYFSDPALESRFITEEMGRETLRQDVPIALPDDYRDEARRLRNKLLLYRFRTYRKLSVPTATFDRSIEPRLNQIFSPLAAIVGDGALKKDIHALARQYQRDLITERSMEVEAQVLSVIRKLLKKESANQVAIKDIAKEFSSRYRTEYDSAVTPKWIGTIVRRKLQLRPHKSHGTYVIPRAERPRLLLLFKKYGVDDKDVGDFGDESDGRGESNIALRGDPVS